MNAYYDSQFVFRTQKEWKALLDQLLQDLSNHLARDLTTCGYFIEEQLERARSHGCHVDFRCALSDALELELCGILCYSVNWGQRVSVGAYLLYFQSGKRLEPTSCSDTVFYLSRDSEGWGAPYLEPGHGDEWTRYDTTERWDRTPDQPPWSPQG